MNDVKGNLVLTNLLSIPTPALSGSGLEGIISAADRQHPLIIGCKGTTKKQNGKTFCPLFVLGENKNRRISLETRRFLSFQIVFAYSATSVKRLKATIFSSLSCWPSHWATVALSPSPNWNSWSTRQLSFRNFCTRPLAMFSIIGIFS